MTRTLSLLAGLALITTASSVRAENLSLKPYAAIARPMASMPTPLPSMSLVMSLARDTSPRISRPFVSLPVGYANAPALLPRGIAKTSVESRLTTDGPVASAGVLCGLKPNVDQSGMGTARGYDNDGRFVGAKLAFSF